MSPGFRPGQGRFQEDVEVRFGLVVSPAPGSEEDDADSQWACSLVNHGREFPGPAAWVVW